MLQRNKINDLADFTHTQSTPALVHRIQTDSSKSEATDEAHGQSDEKGYMSDARNRIQNCGGHDLNARQL